MAEISDPDFSLIQKRQEKLVKYLRNTLLVLPSSIMLLDNSKFIFILFKKFL
jgi:hypothetical protein